MKTFNKVYNKLNIIEMGILLHISTKSSDHEQEYYTPIRVPEVSKTALSDATFWYSLKNISSKKGNNIFKLNEQIFTLPDCMYNVKDIQNYLRDHYCHILGEARYDDHKKCYDIPIEFYINKINLRCNIDLKPNTKLDLTVRDFNKIIGYHRQVFESGNEKLTIQGPRNIDITDRFESFLIHCSQFGNNGLGSEVSDIIETYSVRVKRGQQISIRPFNLKYFDIERREIKEIRMRITDQNNRLLDLDHETITYTLYIKYPDEN